MTINGSTQYEVLEHTRQRQAEVRLAYGPDDVEVLAESMGVSISDEEMEAVLENVDGELVSLARRGTHDALRSRIAELLQIVSRAHAESDDD
jgi:hypothetical protein